ncbi:MAG: hypothetical protein GVY26_00630 [Bacteroidetes bacterium]|jgi:hypothetical protein|nr:hypothetical protein [Bacteroidota bacterium]
MPTLKNSVFALKFFFMKNIKHPKQKKLFELLHKLYNLQGKNFPKHYMESMELSKTPVYYRINGKSSISFEEGCQLCSDHRILVENDNLHTNCGSNLEFVREVLSCMGKDREVEVVVALSSCPAFLFDAPALRAFEAYFQRLLAEKATSSPPPFTSFNFGQKHTSLMELSGMADAKKTVILSPRLFDHFIERMLYVDDLGLFQSPNVKKRLLQSLMRQARALKRFIAEPQHRVTALNNTRFELNNLILVHSAEASIVCYWSSLLSKAYLLSDKDCRAIKQSIFKKTPFLENIFPYNSKAFNSYFKAQHKKLSEAASVLAN